MRYTFMCVVPYNGESCGFYFSKFNPGAFVAQVIGRGPLRWEKLGDLPSQAYPWNFQATDVGRGTVSRRVVSHSRLYYLRGYLLYCY